MKKDARQKERNLGQKKKKVMAYININKRITELVKMELLEEKKPDPYTVNIHGRKDYKLTMKGLINLRDHMIEHVEDIEGIVRYMVKNKMDKRFFASFLNFKAAKTLSSLNLYCKFANVTVPNIKWDKEGRVTNYAFTKLEGIEPANIKLERRKPNP